MPGVAFRPTNTSNLPKAIANLAASIRGFEVSIPSSEHMMIYKTDCGSMVEEQTRVLHPQRVSLLRKYI